MMQEIKPKFLLLFTWGALLLAFPPVEWCWMAFLGVVPLVWLILKPERDRWFYGRLWIFGTLFWICEAHFVRYPHPVNSFLLVGLGGYLGVYWPLFVGVSRIWIHRILPRILPEKWQKNDWKPVAALGVVPLAWVACDLLRYWIFTGYFMSSLCHAFYRWTFFIQTADLVGEWGTTATIVFLATCLATYVSRKEGRFVPRTAPVLGLLLMGLFIVGYGMLRDGGKKSESAGCVALLQGNIPAQLTVDAKLTAQTEEQYFQLVRQAKKMAQDGGLTLDLVVFPESIYRHPVVFAQERAKMPPGLVDEKGQPMTQAVFEARLANVAAYSQQNLKDFCQLCGVPLVTGCNTDVYAENGLHCYNSAISIRPESDAPEGIYNKMHLVPFGEYVPFLRTLQQWFPKLEQLSPIGAGGNMGEKPVAWTIPIHGGKTRTACVNICFESAVGRLIRWQVATLRAEGMDPDFLLNVTNNGWFRQSNESKLHLACAVFRAVENRKPMLVAANFGISASINSDGKILQQIPTGQTGVLLATMDRDGRTTGYTRWGFLGRWIPLGFLGIGIVWGLATRYRGSSKSSDSDK